MSFPLVRILSIPFILEMDLVVTTASTQISGPTRHAATKPFLSRIGTGCVVSGKYLLSEKWRFYFCLWWLQYWREPLITLAFLQTPARPWHFQCKRKGLDLSQHHEDKCSGSWGMGKSWKQSQKEMLWRSWVARCWQHREQGDLQCHSKKALMIPMPDLCKTSDRPLLATCPVPLPHQEQGTGGTDTGHLPWDKNRTGMGQGQVGTWASWGRTMGSWSSALLWPCWGWWPWADVESGGWGWAGGVLVASELDNNLGSLRKGDPSEREVEPETEAFKSP